MAWKPGWLLRLLLTPAKRRWRCRFPTVPQVLREQRIVRPAWPAFVRIGINAEAENHHIYRLVVPAAANVIGDSGRFAYGRVRAALPSIPIETGSAFRIKETVNNFRSSPQTEGLDK
jgi:hypothetical protein